MEQITFNVEDLKNILDFVAIKNKRRKKNGINDEWTAEDELKSIDSLYKYNAMAATSVIPHTDAQRYHDNHKNFKVGLDTTRAIYLTMRQLFSAIISSFGTHLMSSPHYHDAAMYVYLIRYDNTPPTPGSAHQTSVVVQIADDQGGASSPKLVSDLYNLGDLCPPKCPALPVPPPNPPYPILT